MTERNYGKIVNVCSVAGVYGNANMACYSATKAAVVAMTKALAKELGPSGITVNCVAPGVIDTAMNSHLGAEILSELADETPLCRLGSPEEVAESILFLASEKASFITGQVLGVNGGFVI